MPDTATELTATTIAAASHAMAELTTLRPALAVQTGFRFGALDMLLAPHLPVLPVDPPLGPLAAFKGDWAGSGFNTIFRPDSAQTPTPLPLPVTGSDNILELNLTTETLSFSADLGSVPNRGAVQGDAFLNGVPYAQSISDVTIKGKSTGIHFEPGLWMAVPKTSDPAEGATLARMASIPHGTTINAQGTSFVVAGGPRIDPVDMTPFVAKTGTKVPKFPSQTAANKNTPRIPQDLTSFISDRTITQAMLDDPNVVLRNRIAGQNIVSTTVITISTSPGKPLFGGGTENIAFLLGDTTVANPNAQATQMTAIFWIETVEHTLHIPVLSAGSRAFTLDAEVAKVPGQPVAKFLIDPPHPITVPRTIKVQSTQIQYTQTVFLNFKGLIWPHISVATLVPAATQTVPPTAWA